MTTLFRTLLLTSVLLLTACGTRLDGTYVDGMGLTGYTFKTSGKAYFEALGIESEFSYEIDDDRVKLHKPDGDLILKLEKDGTLQGPLGIIYTKKKQ
jgi:hypothetical protein